MANIKISELNELANAEDNDYLAVVDSSDDETKKISLENIKNYNMSIIETGSNNNGNWIKFANGVAFCWKKYSGTTNIATTIGGGYRSLSIGGEDLPINITEITGAWIDGQCDFVDENKWCWALMNGKATTTKFPSLNFISNNTSSSRDYTAFTYVLGKWNNN